MLGSLLFGLARGMQRIREQQQGGNERGIFGAEHAGLATSVRVSSEEETTGAHFSKGGEGVLQPGAVASRIARAGRTEGPRLAIGQIAAKHGKAATAEGFRQRHEKRGCCVRTCAVGQDETIAVGILRRVEKTADLGIDGTVVEFANRSLGQAIILNRSDEASIRGRKAEAGCRYVRRTSVRVS